MPRILPAGESRQPAISLSEMQTKDASKAAPAAGLKLQLGNQAEAKPLNEAEASPKAAPSADQAAPATNGVQSAKEANAGTPAPAAAPEIKYPKPFPNVDMDEELKPLLSFRISDGDAAAIKDVFTALGKGDEDAAKAAIAKITDPAARKFAEWRRLRSTPGRFKEAVAFGAANPTFPQLPQDSANEKALFLIVRPGG